MIASYACTIALVAFAKFSNSSFVASRTLLVKLRLATRGSGRAALKMYEDDLEKGRGSQFGGYVVSVIVRRG